jgi:hypothetical protein
MTTKKRKTHKLKSVTENQRGKINRLSIKIKNKKGDISNTRTTGQRETTQQTKRRKSLFFFPFARQLRS